MVGSTLLALETVINKTNGIVHAFNPIGGLHHARRNAAAGFCVFNDIGIAIMQARKKYNLKKILYIDIDAHHGDGVFYEFEDDPDIPVLIFMKMVLSYILGLVLNQKPVQELLKAPS